MTKTLQTIGIAMLSLQPLLAQSNKHIGAPHRIGKIESQKNYRQSIRDRPKSNTAQEAPLEPRGQRSPVKLELKPPHSSTSKLIAYLELSPDATTHYLDSINAHRIAIHSIHREKNLPTGEFLKRIHEACAARDQNLQTILTERQLQLLRSFNHFNARPKIKKTGVQFEQDLLLLTKPLELTLKQVNEIKAARNFVINRNRRDLHAGKKQEDLLKSDNQYWLRLEEILTEKQSTKLRELPGTPILIPKITNLGNTPEN